MLHEDSGETAEAAAGSVGWFVLPSSALSSSGLAPRAEGLPAPRMMATDDQFAGRREGPSPCCDSPGLA